MYKLLNLVFYLICLFCILQNLLCTTTTFLFFQIKPRSLDDTAALV